MRDAKPVADVRKAPSRSLDLPSTLFAEAKTSELFEWIFFMSQRIPVDYYELIHRLETFGGLSGIIPG